MHDDGVGDGVHHGRARVRDLDHGFVFRSVLLFVVQPVHELGPRFVAVDERGFVQHDHVPRLVLIAQHVDECVHARLFQRLFTRHHFLFIIFRFIILLRFALTVEHRVRAENDVVAAHPFGKCIGRHFALYQTNSWRQFGLNVVTVARRLGRTALPDAVGNLVQHGLWAEVEDAQAPGIRVFLQALLIDAFRGTKRDRSLSFPRLEAHVQPCSCRASVRHHLRHLFQRHLFGDALAQRGQRAIHIVLPHRRDHVGQRGRIAGAPEEIAHFQKDA